MTEAHAGLVWPCLDLEYRARGRRLSGSFRYGATAIISDRGRVRKERFAPRAFAYAVDDVTREISLLNGHDFSQPLASKLGGSLRLEDSAQALSFVATLPPESRQPSWVRDAVLSVRAGLVGGISPGFRVPPPAAVPDAETTIPEPGNPGVAIRVIRQAVLGELSLVTRPAYGETEIDLRNATAEALSAPVGALSSDPVGRDLERFYRWL